MAKKIVGIVCGVSWAAFGIGHLFTGPTGRLSTTGAVMSVVGMLIGVGALIALAVLAFIDYARRPR